MEKEEVTSELILIGLAQLTNGYGVLILLSEKDRERPIFMFIDCFSCNAINASLSMTLPPRPSTHDLLADAIQRLGARVSAVVITDFRDNTFYAEVRLDMGGTTIILDARPSDSVALAVRVVCPILVTESFLRKHCELWEALPENEKEARRQIEKQTANEFGNMVSRSKAN